MLTPRAGRTTVLWSGLLFFCFLCFFLQIHDPIKKVKCFFLCVFFLSGCVFKTCTCVCACVGGCDSSHHLDNYGSFYRWALKDESVITNMSHWHLGKACNTHTLRHTNTHRQRRPELFKPIDCRTTHTHKSCRDSGNACFPFFLFLSCCFNG